MPTLSDVAKIAGVGVMSVSRVVNGTRRVSPSTERKVREALRQVGYVPNEAARILKGQPAHVLGLIVPDLSNPFFATCANAFHETAWRAGYLTLMASSFHDEEVESRITEIMVSRRVAGIAAIPSGSRDDHFAQVQESGIPIVSLDRPFQRVEADTLVVDNRPAARFATKHLIEHGHRNILCVAEAEMTFTKRERVEGYSEAMRRAKLPVRISLVDGLSRKLSDQLDLALKTRPKVSAVFAINDVLAVGVLKQLRKLSIAIPDEIALIAFDDFDAATLVRPTITVVRQPVADLGRKAAAVLLDRLNNPKRIEASEIVLKTKLIVRESCGCSIKKE
jgi:LacI family transcriptional regulator